MRQEVLNLALEYYLRKIKETQMRVNRIRGKAVESPGAMESWSDKSKDEYSQLADGLARELKPLKSTVKTLESLLGNNKKGNKIDIGNIVHTSSKMGKNDDYMLIVPEIGGDIITHSGIDIFLLSAKSELAKKLIGLEMGDELSWKGDRLTITRILND